MKGLKDYDDVVQTILKKQCKLAGVDPNKLDFSSTEWYRHKWSTKKQFPTYLKIVRLKHKPRTTGSVWMCDMI